MECAKCGKRIPDKAAFCPFCGEKTTQDSLDKPIYESNIKTLLKSGKLIVYRDRTEFVTSSVQKATYSYANVVSVKKNALNGIDFIMDDGRTETCPADRKCVHEALVYIKQAAEVYIAKRRERLLSQGIRYSFPSNQGIMNDGVLNLSNERAEFKAKSGRTEIVLYSDVKSVSAFSGTLDFKLFSGATKSYAVSRELRDEVLSFVTDSVAPFLARRNAELLSRGIYFSSYGSDGGTLDIYADRAEYRNRSGDLESGVPFQDIRTAGLRSGMLELALTDGTTRRFPVDEDIAADILDFVKAAIKPYVAARTVGFDTAFGVDERIEFNNERGVFHLIRQGGKEITTECPVENLTRCEWTENGKLTAFGSVVSGGIDLFKSAAKAAANQSNTGTEEKIGRVDIFLHLRGEQGEETQSLCFGRSSVGMRRSDKKYCQCLQEWDGLSGYLKALIPGCELIDPVIPEPEPAEPAAPPEIKEEQEPECAGIATPEETSEVPSTAARQDDPGISQFSKYISGVGRFIGSCKTPMSIAFQGNWGTGEDSALWMLFEEMKEQYSRNLFWLNVKQFLKNESGEELSALVGVVLTGLLNGEIHVTKQTGNLLAGLAGLATGIFAGDSSIGKELAGGVLNKEPVRQQDHPAMAFSKQISKKLQSKDGKFLFFIDGLDRLPPSRAVEVLDAMRDFFECKGCVFVVAVNYEHILRGAQERFGENKARMFFNEIFKMSFRVPANSFNLKGYVQGMLENIGIQTGDDEELDLYVALIQCSVGKDKEAIDRLFTSLQLLGGMAGEWFFRDRYMRLALFALLCMQTRFPDAYRFAVEHKDSVTPEFLAALCGSSAQPWNKSQADGVEASYHDFGAVFAQVVNLDSLAEITQEECKAFADVLNLSFITSSTTF